MKKAWYYQQRIVISGVASVTCFLSPQLRQIALLPLIDGQVDRKILVAFRIAASPNIYFKCW